MNTFQQTTKLIFSLATALVLSSCNAQETKIPTTMNHPYTNKLIEESSPYLLQHAHNPVDWMPWGPEALAKAKQENKLLIISVGYAACHWCHVMEHESFENDSVAAIMNKYFVSIKVDREERPDIDQVYMDAVQLMTGQGGWPLNCIALPDGRPVYGGTYFKREEWMQVLQQLANLHAENPEKMEEYAANLTEGLQQNDLVHLASSDFEFAPEVLLEGVAQWSKNWDLKEGGPNRAPKFPLPNNYLFLLRFAHLYNDIATKNYLKLTLDKMMMGGIYDQIGGGFARYSVDALWKAPHFEKMLYDNAQLISLYSEAYKVFGDESYKNVVDQCIEFCERELYSTEHKSFYSSLDADSEGEEGKFYVWKKEELKKALGADFEFAANYYNINQHGLWEDDNYILLRRESDHLFQQKYNLSEEEFDDHLFEIKNKLMITRSKRIRPGLDDKTLTSWNGLMLKGLCDAYKATGNLEYLELAKNNASFIVSKQVREDGGLNHNFKNGTSTINGYLEDYAFVIDGLIALYESTLNREYLTQAHQLTNYAIDHFSDEHAVFFYFTSDQDEKLIARKQENTDNVIPASNSAMANNLLVLGHLMDNNAYIKRANRMIASMSATINQQLPWLSNWGIGYLKLAKPAYEVVIMGEDALEYTKEFNQYFLPNVVLSGSTQNMYLPLMENKFVEGKTLLYVCSNKACKLPSNTVDEAIKQIK